MRWCTKLGAKDVVLYQQQNCAELCQCIELEVATSVTRLGDKAPIGRQIRLTGAVSAILTLKKCHESIFEYFIGVDSKLGDFPG